MRPALPCLLLCACSGAFGSKADTGGSGGSGGGDTAADTDTHGLPDLTDGLDEGGCEEVSDQAHPGAAMYFVGTYWKSGDAWKGEERWLLFANEAWKATGEDDCVIVWDMAASDSDTGTCGACDLGLAVAGTIDLSATTCPEGLYKDEENFTEDYAVLLGDDDTTRWYYGGSGTLFGNGYTTGDAMNFVTDKSCAWF